MLKQTLTAAVVAALVCAAAGCNRLGLGPQKRAEEPAAVSGKLYEPDMRKPDGPMLQVLRAAQERDFQLFKASFAPSVDTSRIDEELFRRLRKKVLTNRVTPVPDSVQQVSDTEAVVKVRNHRGREIPIHVRKFDDKWLITRAEFGPRFIQRYREMHPDQPPITQPSPPPANP